MKRLVFAVVLVLLASRAVRADVPPAPAPPPAPGFDPTTPAAPPATPAAPPTASARRWYGWQILATDAATAAVWVGAARTGLAPLFVLGAVTYIASGPLIHDANDHDAVVIPSLVARVAAPLVGIAAAAFLELSVCPSPPDGGYFYTSCQRQGGLIALAAPMLVTSLVDIAFSWTPARDTSKTSDVAWTPTLTPTSGAGAALGFAGKF
jgi:hypothetical protein